MCIDAHAHVFARASAEFPRQTDDRLPPEREEPVEKLLEEMQTHGVEGAVLVQIGGAQAEHHAYLRHCLKTYPGRFLGIGLIPDHAPSTTDHMDRLADQGDIIGFRLFRIGGPLDPFAPMDIRTFETYPVWEHAAAKDYVLWLYPRAADAHLIPFLVDAFPQVRVVFNHLMICPGEGALSWDDKGRPRIEVPVDYPRTGYSTLGLCHYENVYIHLSGHYAFSKQEWPYRDLAVWHERLANKGFGTDRLMWATDFPWIAQDPGYGPLTRIVNELLPDLNQVERANIMGDNAKRVLRFPQ